MSEDYQATDDDLPEFFWSPRENGGSGAGGASSGAGNSSTARAATAVQLHYPEIRVKQEQRRAARIMHKHEREGTQLEGNDRKQFIKLSKKLQMWDWLNSLEQTFPIMRGAERQFCEQLLAKFRKYTPYATKWVTRKQYDWLLFISTQYLQVPK